MPGEFTSPAQIKWKGLPQGCGPVGKGSNIAATICNAMLYMASGDARE